MSEIKSGWEGLNEEQLNEIHAFANHYMDFLNDSKTEREVIDTSEVMARDKGFRNISEFESIKPGDKVYFINRRKNIFLAVIGTDPLDQGVNIIGAHADSPRLDLKPKPLYEKDKLALFDTHYYGGIKKYQWTAIPLAIHGVIVKKNGEKVKVRIGEDYSDPVFTVTDLLPHLAKKQLTEKLGDAIKGENLDLLVGSIPANNTDKDKDKVKQNILNLLNQKYGIEENDFQSSELEIVPAFKARHLGFDSSMVGAYGQDDKVCVYTSLRAILDVENPRRTAVCLFSDKEEIGSMGNTGMCSNMFTTFVTELLEKAGYNQINAANRLFANSKMLSADVDAGVNPLYDDVQDKGNCAYVGFGMSVNKYTGSGGKYNSSDANAEYVAEIRNLFDENGIRYQLAELGKVDEGGGGTIAYILANQGVDVIDCGVPVISMHSPLEVTSKFDIFTAYRAYNAFLR